MRQPSYANLYLPGLAPDGSPKTLIDIPGYWQHQSSDQRRGGPGDAFLSDLVALLDRASGRMSDAMSLGTLVVLDQVNKLTGEIEQRRVGHNVVTDIGAQGLLKALYNANQTIGQYIILDVNAATSTLNGALTAALDLTTTNTNNGPAINSGAPSAAGNKAAVTGNKAASYISNTTSVACTSGSVGATDPTTSGGINLGYGTANSEYFSSHATQANAGNVKAAAGVTKNTHASGDWVVAQPQTGDGLGTGGTAFPGTAIIYNSTTSTNAATATAAPATISGTGIGARQALWSSLTFTTTSTAGSYNELWIVNATTIAAVVAASGCYNHLAYAPLTLNATTQIVLNSYAVKL